MRKICTPPQKKKQSCSEILSSWWAPDSRQMKTELLLPKWPQEELRERQHHPLLCLRHICIDIISASELQSCHGHYPLFLVRHLSLCPRLCVCSSLSRASCLLVSWASLLLRSQSMTKMKAEEHFFPLFWVFLHSVGHQPPMSAPMAFRQFCCKIPGGSFSAHLSRLGPHKNESFFVSLIPSLS